MKEPTATKENDIDYGNFATVPDSENADLVDLVGALFHSGDHNDDPNDIEYDYGASHDWSKRAIEVSVHCCLCVFEWRFGRIHNNAVLQS